MTDNDFTRALFISRRMIAVVLALCGSILALSPGFAQSWPTRQITMVYPYAAGGIGDYLARLLSQHLSTNLGRTVVVENLPGASGSVGYGSLLGAPADGYRIALGVNDLPLNDTLQPDRGFKSSDFTGVATIASGAFLLVANPKFPPNSTADLIAYAKAHPNEVTVSTSATTQSIILTDITNKTGAQFKEIKFVNVGQQITSVLSGEVNLAWTTYLTAKSQLDSGALKAIAVSTQSRVPQLPNTPAIAETVPGVDFAYWFGFVVKKGTPQDVIDRLARATADTIGIPEVRDAINDRGMSVISGEGPAELTARIGRDAKTYAELFKAPK